MAEQDDLSGLVSDFLARETKRQEADAAKQLAAGDLNALQVWGKPTDEPMRQFQERKTGNYGMNYNPGNSPAWDVLNKVTGSMFNGMFTGGQGVREMAGKHVRPTRPGDADIDPNDPDKRRTLKPTGSQQAAKGASDFARGTFQAAAPFLIASNPIGAGAGALTAIGTNKVISPLTRSLPYGYRELGQDAAAGAVGLGGKKLAESPGLIGNAAQFVRHPLVGIMKMLQAAKQQAAAQTTTPPAPVSSPPGPLGIGTAANLPGMTGGPATASAGPGRGTPLPAAPAASLPLPSRANILTQTDLLKALAPNNFAEKLPGAQPSGLAAAVPGLQRPPGTTPTMGQLTSRTPLGSFTLDSARKAQAQQVLDAMANRQRLNESLERTPGPTSAVTPKGDASKLTAPKPVQPPPLRPSELTAEGPKVKNMSPPVEKHLGQIEGMLKKLVEGEKGSPRTLDKRTGKQ